MKISTAGHTKLQLRLRSPVPGSDATARHGYAIRLRDDMGNTAAGEIAPLEGWHRETLADIERVLTPLEEALTGSQLDELVDVGRLLSAADLGMPSIVFGVEMAWLFLQAERIGRAPARVLCPDPTEVVPLSDLFAGDLEEALSFSTRRNVVKVKVGQRAPAEDRAVLTRLFDRNPAARWRLDGNRAHTLADARELLRGLDASRIEYFEEPLRDPTDLPALHDATGIGLALDETRREPEHEELWRARGVTTWVCKPALHGGFHAALELAREGREAGIACVISSSFESERGLRALAQLAACVQPPRTAAGLGTDRWLIQDSHEPPFGAGAACAIVHHWSDELDPVARALEQRGERALLRDIHGELTGHGALAEVLRVARELEALGSCEGEVVAILPDLSRHCVLALLALWHAKLTTFVLPAREPEARLSELIAERGCRLVLSARDLPTDAALLPPTSLFEPTPERVELTGDPTVLSGAATILATSGSTGEPKLVVHALRAHLASARTAIGTLGLDANDTWLLNLPLYHVGGLAPLFRALVSGASLALPGSTAEATHVSVVATQLERSLANQEEAASLARCKTVLAGGGPIPISLRKRALDAGVPLVVSYGSTETASLVTAERDPAAMCATHTAGRPLPGREIRTSEAGEIHVRGSSLFSGYLTSRGVEDPRDDEGWFATGDLGRLDAEGRLLVDGRADRMFVSGGENVHPEEIESALLELDGVDEATVLAIPHAEYGERPIAFVRVAHAATGAELAEQLATRLPRYKIPDAFYRRPPNASTEQLRRLAGDAAAFEELRL